MILSGKELLLAFVALIIIFVGVLVTKSKPVEVPLKAAEPPKTEVAISLHTVHSPDGARKVVLKTQPLSEGQMNYVVTTSDMNGSDRHGIYEATLKEGSEIVLSPNSWSPDNKFVFIKTNKEGVIGALVFQQDGSSCADGTMYIDVSSIFNEQFSDRTIRDISGWDDSALLHVMTFNTDNTVGFSYWFDIWGKSFIQLAHR